MRHLLELHLAAAEKYLGELTDVAEIATLQKYVDRLNRTVGARVPPSTASNIVKMADHAVTKRRRTASAGRTRSALAAAVYVRQHRVNEYGDSFYDDD